MSKREAIAKLRTCLAGLFDSRHHGAAAVRYARAQGFADGYMQALSDMGLVEDRELLDLVGEERRLASRRAEIRLPSTPPAPTFAWAVSGPRRPPRGRRGSPAAAAVTGSR